MRRLYAAMAAPATVIASATTVAPDTNTVAPDTNHVSHHHGWNAKAVRLLARSDG